MSPEPDRFGEGLPGGGWLRDTSRPGVGSAGGRRFETLVSMGEVPLVLVGVATGSTLGADLQASVGAAGGWEILQGPALAAAGALAVAELVEEGWISGHQTSPAVRRCTNAMTISGG